MAKPPRKHTPTDIELRVLELSRRRCALCFGLNGDLREKHGQIAHLDDDRTNFAEDNLGFLCMEHHSLYDSRTSQHKNYTMQEVHSARKALYAAVANGQHATFSSAPQTIPATLTEAKLSALKNLHEALVKGHFEINRRAKAAPPLTEAEYRSEVEVHEFSFLQSLALAEIYLDGETSGIMHEVLGSLRQMCTSIWLRMTEVFEVREKYADDAEIREPDWRLFHKSFDAAQAALKMLLNPLEVADVKPRNIPSLVIAASVSLSAVNIQRDIKRMKIEWDLNRTVRAGMFQKAEAILRRLHQVIINLYSELSEDQASTATTLVRSALQQTDYLENVPISHSTDVHAYWTAGDHIFDLLTRALACLQAEQN